MLRRALLLAGLTAGAYANPAMRRQEPTPVATRGSAPPFTAVTACHNHGSTQYCMAGSDEYQIIADPKVTPRSSYTACHLRSTETYCMAPGGGEVRLTKDGDESHGALSTSQPAPVGTMVSSRPPITAITSCSMKESSLHCLNEGTEYVVKTKMTQTTNVPAQVTGCHSHGIETYCMLGNADVPIAQAGTAATEEKHGDADAGERHCHFHAGIEHCVGGAAEQEVSCDRVDRQYNIHIRIGMLFVVLTTSAIGVFGPIFLARFFKVQNNVVLIVLKQFGTGVILSTAFIHLYTHASLMFAQPCLGKLEYEATTSAIVMAGIFISFLIDYFTHRVMHKRTATFDGISVGLSAREIAQVELANVSVLEAGIIFHSLLIGLSLVVAGDSTFGTLVIVIIFHQIFEGIALGTRIAAVGTGTSAAAAAAAALCGHSHSQHHHVQAVPEPKGSPVISPSDGSESGTAPTGVSVLDKASTCHVPLWKKLALGAAFALITPIGMAIGIGVLHLYNGADKSTIIALATLNAFSAGILVWIGVAEMLARDWTGSGELSPGGVHGSKKLVVALSMFGLVAGMVLMSFLGKWA